MSEIGLQKLTEYLNQTRRQAESAIDVLNNKIAELSSDNEKAMKLAEKFESERDYYRNYAEQLKVENSKKWRLQERDDWKSLVDSVQKDRNRLQNDCLILENSLELAKEQIKSLEIEIEELRSQLLSASSSSSNTSDIRNNEANNNVDGDTLSVRHNIPPINTFSAPSSPSILSTPSSTPSKAITRQLKMELEKAHSQLEEQRRAADTENLAQKKEIIRLRQQLMERGISVNTVDVQLTRSNTTPSTRHRQSGTLIRRDSWLPTSLLQFLFPSVPIKGNSEILHV